MKILKVNNVTKEFDGLKAVNDVSFSLEEGKMFGLIGPNGAGKTTLFNLITGEIKLTRGHIFFKEENIVNKENYERPGLGIARTFQNTKLFSDITVLENLIIAQHIKIKKDVLAAAFHLKKFTKEEKIKIDKAIEVLKFLEIDSLIDSKASDLAYGQQRLVEIARAILTEPKLLLLDEPCAGLNAQETEKLREKLVKVNKDNITILCVEHNMDFIMGFADKIIVLDHGKLILKGGPKEVSNDPRVIEAYLGKEDG